MFVRTSKARKTQESFKEEWELRERQIRDIVLQNQSLSKEVERLRDATVPSDADTHEIQPASNADEFITNNPALYESIPQLVKRSMTSLHSAQELTTKMERNG